MIIKMIMKITAKKTIKKLGMTRNQTTRNAFLMRRGITTIILTTMVVGTLTNCSMLGIHDQSFECPPEEGMKCTSASSVNKAIDQLGDQLGDPLDGDLDEKYPGSLARDLAGDLQRDFNGSTPKDLLSLMESRECKDCGRIGDLGGDLRGDRKRDSNRDLSGGQQASKNSKKAVDSFEEVVPSRALRDYIREQEQTMRIWLAPHVVGGVMMEESFARIVSRQGSWKRVSGFSNNLGPKNLGPKKSGLKKSGAI